MITDPIVVAFAELGHNIPELLFGALTSADLAKKVAASVSTAFDSAFKRIGGDFITADLDARIIQIATDAQLALFDDKTPLKPPPKKRVIPPAVEQIDSVTRALTPSDREAILSRELALLDKEVNLLRLVGDERAVLSTQLDIEEKIRRALREANKDLSEAEINRLAQLETGEAASIDRIVRRNEAIRRQADLLEEIDGPARIYGESLTALNTLLSNGKIASDDYTRAQRDLQLAFLRRPPRIE